jgi:DinB superfamily
MANSPSKQRLFHQLARGPLDVAKAWRTAPPRLRRFVPAPGKWSIADVIVHLLDTEVANAWRLRHVVGDANATIEPFDENRWAVELRYGDRDVAAALSAYAALRLANLDLARNFTKRQLATLGNHTQRGPITAQWVLERMAWHDAAHLAQMERNREALAASRTKKRKR